MFNDELEKVDGKLQAMNEIPTTIADGTKVVDITTSYMTETLRDSSS